MASERLPQYSPDELKAMSEETHLQGKLITAHATIPDAIRNVVDAGFDCIEHGGPADDDVLEEIVRRGIFVVPTLSPCSCKPSAVPPRACRSTSSKRARSGSRPTRPAMVLARMAEAGIKMAFGTDAGSPCVPHDEILAEMQKLIEVGIAKTAARCHPDADRQQRRAAARERQLRHVEPGKYADLLLVEGNPVQNIDDIANVSHVFLGGRRVFGSVDQPQLLV